MISLTLFLASLILAIVAYLLPKIRLITASSAILLMAVSCGYIAATMPYGFGLGFLLVSIYQIFNIARLVVDRLHAKHLRLAFFIGGSRILGMQVTLYTFGRLTNHYERLSLFWGNALVVIQALVAILVLGLVVRRLISSKPKNIETFLSDRELPTVSVLIPARNEDNDLMEALRSVVANDYPKLEILVLDDCSTTGRIPEIVKEFAHDGVRFIQGDEPRENWLAKNQAYGTLADSASGEWLLFMGVDVRLGSGSIRALVNYAHNNKRSMLSVLPHRNTSSFWPGFFSPLRYLREILKVSIYKPSVPALSTAWLVSRKSYDDLGGIESVARKVVPEHYFANRLSKLGTYAFVRTNDQLQVTTAKNLREQMNTSLRVIYPGFHGRLEWSAISSMGALLLLFAPFVQLGYHATNSGGAFTIVYAGIVSVLSVAHLLIALTTNPVLWPLAVVNFPYLVLQEIVLGFISMYRYEFGNVYWKQRNICLPIMQVIPRLPDIKNPASRTS